MGIKSYCVSLEEKVVERALKISKRYGSKFSPLLNQIITGWCDDEERKTKGDNN